MIADVKELIHKWNNGELEKREDTPLCVMYKKYGSDKKDIYPGFTHHNYSNFYYHIFQSIKEDDNNIFELGMGTNDPNLPSSMGVDGRPGASLYALEEFFPYSKIFGADIDRKILFNKGRIKTFYCDQTNSDVIAKMWSLPDLVNTDFDIIIEDGLHEFRANLSFLVNSLHKVKSKGVYLAEDLPLNVRDLFHPHKEKIVKTFNLHVCEIIQMNQSPLLVIQRN